MLAKKNAEMQEKLEENKGKELDFNSDIVQTIFPLTGAFPGNDMRYIASIKNMNLQNITNDFILKLGWAKVTNEDLASSYQGEGLPSTIDAKILDNYIKDIFGDIAYVKDDFSNIDLRLEASDNSLYDITYNQEEDKYYINFIEDDKVEDSFILNIDPKVIQYDNKIEISSIIETSDGTYDNNPTIITQDEATQIAINKEKELTSREIESTSSEIGIRKMNSYIYQLENNIDNTNGDSRNKANTIATELKIRKVWIITVKHDKAFKKNMSDLEYLRQTNKEYYIDITTGEIIGGEEV